MRCIDGRWPFRPAHITCDGGPEHVDPALHQLCGTGIITNRHLQGLQSRICHEIGLPTTILEFSVDGTPVRTDSPFLQYAMRDSCRALREFTLAAGEDEAGGGGLCSECDACHATLYRGLSSESLSSSAVLAARDSEPCLSKLYAGDPKCDFNPRVVGGRVICEYDCPLLGYREIVLPIMFEDHVLATLFAGQIALQERLRFIEERTKSIIDRIPGCFEECLRTHEAGMSAGDVVAAILEAHRNSLVGNGAALSSAQYDSLVLRTSRELSGLEEQLHMEVRRQRREYINLRVGKQLAYLQSVHSTKSQQEREALDYLWSCVKTACDSVVSDFGLRYILAFGVSRSIALAEQEPLEVVAAAGGWRGVVSEEDLGRMRIVSQPDRYVVSSPTRNPECLGFLRGCDTARLGDFNLVFVPVPVHRQSSVAFLVGYDDVHTSSASENIPGGDLDSALRGFNMLVVALLSGVLAGLAERSAVLQLLYLNHEGAQLTSGLSSLRDYYMSSPQKLRRIDAQKARDLSTDLEGFGRQFYFLFELAGKLTSDLPKPKMERFFPHRNLLLKWKDMYRLTAEKKALQFPQYVTSRYDEERPKIVGDIGLLEQLVYNLVNNAVKYCHRGTKIHLDCRRDSSDATRPILLTVRDYGKAMPMHGRVFELEWHGDDAEKGLGFGLFLAKQIAIAHGGTIKQECNEVSPYNVPLMEHYVRLPSDETEESLRDGVKHELERLRASRQYQDIVALDEAMKPRYRPTPLALLKEITKPTFEVTINVRLPEGVQT